MLCEGFDFGTVKPPATAHGLVSLRPLRRRNCHWSQQMMSPLRPGGLRMNKQGSIFGLFRLSWRLQTAQNELLRQGKKSPWKNVEREGLSATDNPDQNIKLGRLSFSQCFLSENE